MPMFRHARRRALRAVVAGFTAPLLVSCSMPRLAYNQADWLMLRQLDSYLDLRDEQRERAAGVLAVHLERHRREQLPDVARTLREAAQRARSGLRENDASWVVDRGRSLLTASAEDLLPHLAGTLADLDADQRAHLRERLAERNRDAWKRYGLDRSWEEQQERGVQRTVRRVEYWTGPLSEEQVALVRELRAAMPDTAGPWLAYTQAQQQRLLALLDARAPAAEVEAFLRAWWLRLEDMPPALAATREWRLDTLRALLVRLSASLDSVQREHLVNRLESFAEDASSLATST